jgi:hypothetical protein
MGVLWVAIGPYLIYLYDERLLPSFFQKIKDLFEDKKFIEDLDRKYNTVFSKGFYKFGIFWCALGIFIFFINGRFFEFYQIKFLSVPFFLIMVDFLIVGLITSIGFWGVLTTIRAIYEVSKAMKDINPFHGDTFGGLRVFSNFAIGTTLLFSSGALFIPMIIDFASRAHNYVSVIYFLFILFIFSILLSYFIPIYMIFNKAKQMKEKALEKLGREYKLLLEKDEQNLYAQVRILNLRNLYLDYKNLKLYPVEIDKILKLISTILIALIIAGFKLYLFRGSAQ